MIHSNGIGNTPQSQPSTTSSPSSISEPVFERALPSGTSAGSQVEVSDHASLSSAGGLVATALETSDVRSDKVASLQQAIAAGSYNVSSSDVAEKLIQSLLE